LPRHFYVGLGARLHDPALAILDDTGSVVFAEGTERSLQHKRAYNAAPDDMLRVPELVREFLLPDAHVVAALSWSDADAGARSRIPFASSIASSSHR
jgi:carbamoyltransferase